MRRVADGESFTVTVHGRPVADLVPHQRPVHRRRRLVPAAEFDEALAALPALDVGQWRQDLREADEIFGADVPKDPWEKADWRIPRPPSARCSSTPRSSLTHLRWARPRSPTW